MKKFITVLFIFISLLPFTIAQKTAQGDHVHAPDFSLYDLDENLISMQDYQGKFVVIHIATTWCPYCNAEAPSLQALSEEYATKNVKVLIIDVKEGKELIDKQLREKFGLTFPILLDIEGAAAAKFAPPDVLPELARDEIMLASNILIDPAGDIQFMSLLDTRNFDSKLIHLRAKLDQLIEEQAQ